MKLIDEKLEESFKAAARRSDRHYGPAAYKMTRVYGRAGGVSEALRILREELL
jgi:hypothetical protein